MIQKNLSINRNVPVKGVLAIAITSILLMSGCNETKPSLSQAEIMENAAEEAISKKKKASDEWLGENAAQDAIGDAAEDAIGDAAEDAIGDAAQDAIGDAAGGFLNTDGYSR